jgi:predicted Zn finger-like uncharacterized protein
MILTCPRCATRYLADETRVWSTGRTVECGGCGQRWRAFGGGVDPHASAEGPAQEPPPAPVAVTPSAGVAAAVPAYLAEDLSTEIHEARLPAFRPIEPPPPVPPRAVSPASPVAEEPLTAASLFMTRPRTAKPPPSRAPAVAVALAILSLTGLAVAAAVPLRAPIVRAFPALAEVYRAVGLAPAAEPAGRHG